MSAGVPERNLFDVCRLCLEREKLLVSVFETDDLQSKISSCLQVEILRTDEVTHKICDDCLNKVDSFYEFWNRTSQSQKELEKWLTQTKEEEKNIQVSHDKSELNDEVKYRLKTGEESIMSIDEEDSIRDEDGAEEEEEYEEEDEDYEEDYENEEDISGEEDVGEDQIRENGSDPTAEARPEPTTFVNVPIESEEPGPSGVEPSESDSITVPETNTKTTVLKGRPDSPLDLRRTLNGKSSPAGNRDKGGKKLRVDNLPKDPSEKNSDLNLCGHRKNKKCELCPYTSSSASNYKIHVMKHNKDYLTKCEECGKGFYNMSYYREHVREKHASKGTAVHRCQVCGKHYHSGSYLRLHSKTHASDYSKRDYQCEVCGRTFLSWKGVKRHIQTIHEGSRHRCDVCGKEVTCLQSLKNHKKIHSGEKSYVCEACGKGFITLNSFVVHKRIHTGEKPYACDLCHKSFSQRSTLKVHRRYHTGERPYQCGFCHKCFVTRTLSKTHEKTHAVIGTSQ